MLHIDSVKRSLFEKSGTSRIIGPLLFLRTDFCCGRYYSTMNIQASLECILQRPSGGTYINKTLPLLSWRIQKEGVPSNPPWWDKKWKKTNWAELSQFHSLLQLDRPTKNIAKKTSLIKLMWQPFFRFNVFIDARFKAVRSVQGHNPPRWFVFVPPLYLPLSQRLS